MKTKSSVSINFAPNWIMLLGVIFVLLKVTGLTMVATWSWWLVLLPFYVGLAIVAFIIAGGAMLAGAVIGGAFLLDGISNVWRRIRRVL